MRGESPYARAVGTAGTADRIERASQEPGSTKALREKAVALLREVVAFEGHVWLLTDPVTGVGTSPLADVPMPWSRLPELTRLRYQATSNRWTDPRSPSRGVSALAGTSPTTPTPDPWRSALADLGVTDVATVVFGDRFGCWAWLDLWRCGGTFTGDELSFLARVRPGLTRGLRLAQSRTFTEHQDATRLSGSAVVLLEPGLQVRSLTATASTTLLELNPPGGAQVPGPVPAAAMNVGAALLAQEAGVPVGPAWSRVHLQGSYWVTLRSERLTEATIAVSIETSTPTERREVFGLVHGLSPREREVLEHAATGADARAMARALALSEHTVHDHIRAVLAKTGSPTRQVLLSRIAGS